MPKGLIGKTFSRTKRGFTARQAWREIAEANDISLKVYKVRRMDTKTHYRWKVVGRK